MPLILQLNKNDTVFSGLNNFFRHRREKYFLLLKWSDLAHLQFLIKVFEFDGFALEQFLHTGNDETNTFARILEIEKTSDHYFEICNYMRSLV